MDLKVVDGCTAYDAEIDGIDVSKMDETQVNTILKEAIHKLIDRETSVNFLKDTLINLVEAQGLLYHTYSCDECGDVVYHYKLEV